MASRPAATSPFHSNGVSSAKPWPAIAAWPSLAWFSSRIPGRRSTDSSAGTPLSLNHCCHQSSPGLMQMLVRDVVRLELAAKPALDLGDAFRAGHGREGRLEQPMLLHPFPAAAAGADRDVGVAAAQVAQFVAGRHPDRKVGMLHLERAEPPRQPGIGEGMRGGDRQQRFVFLAMAGERRLDRVERARQGGQQAGAERGQPGAALLAHEQRRAQPLLEALHLIGNGGLGHPELGGGGGEILRPRSRFEGPDRSQWRKPPHKPTS